MTALDKLKKLTAWESDPALTEAELEEILESVGMPDSEGYGPGEEEWSPTYDINKAAADAWMIKAARAACVKPGIEGGPNPAAKAAAMVDLKAAVTKHLLGAP